MELVGVSHGLTLHQLSRWEELANSLGAEHWHIYDTGFPDIDAKTNQVTVVPNNQFEFGGYLAGAQSVQTEGPYVILNSTVFQTRSLWAWKRIIREYPRCVAPLYGDATPSPDTGIVEIPHPYYASWIFLIRDKKILTDFIRVVEQVLNITPLEFSASYESYLNRWLKPSSRLYGWHGVKTPNALARKMQTIKWEHRLSKELDVLGAQSFANLSSWHPTAQLCDKILRHWASFVKS